MTKTKINHFNPDFIVEKWEPLNKDGYHSGRVYYYDDEKKKILSTLSRNLVAKKHGYLQSTEDFFSQKVESPFGDFINNFETNKKANWDQMKAVTLLLCTMGIRNPSIPNFDKHVLDEDIQKYDWDFIANEFCKKYTFYFLKSDDALFLNVNGLIFLPRLSVDDPMDNKNYPIGMPINLYTLLVCFKNPVSEEHIKKYISYYKYAFHKYSLGLSGKVILPINKKLTTEEENTLIKYINDCRENIIRIKQIEDGFSSILKSMTDSVI